jgi:hypothetical protein
MGDFQGAVGAVGNPGLVFHRFHGTVFSTAFRPTAHHVRTVANRDRAIEVFVDRHCLPGQL